LKKFGKVTWVEFVLSILLTGAKSNKKVMAGMKVFYLTYNQEAVLKN